MNFEVDKIMSKKNKVKSLNSKLKGYSFGKFVLSLSSQVESGYRVFLKCDTVDAEIFYSTNGSYPVDCNMEVLVERKSLSLIRLASEKS